VPRCLVDCRERQGELHGGNGMSLVVGLSLILEQGGGSLFG